MELVIFFGALLLAFAAAMIDNARAKNLQKKYARAGTPMVALMPGPSGTYRDGIEHRVTLDRKTGEVASVREAI